MKTTSMRSVRYAFTMFLLALTVFAVVESAIRGRAAATVAAAEGLSACGTIEQPCVLEPFTVVAQAPAPAATTQLAAEEAPAPCGTEAQPCRLPVFEVRVEAPTGRLASSERAVGMTLRVKS